jgi:ABC-type transport system substrate-binding protein
VDEALWTTAEFIPDVGNFTNNDWRFYHRQGSYFSEQLIQRFTDDMDLIGINVVPVAWTWDWFPGPKIWAEILGRNHFLLYDRNPYSFNTFDWINWLINPDPLLEPHPINNTKIKTLFANILTETDTLLRYEFYKKIQYLVHDKYYYHMPLFYDKVYFVHSETLRGFPYNPMQMLYFYPTYRD